MLSIWTGSIFCCLINKGLIQQYRTLPEDTAVCAVQDLPVSWIP